MTQALELLVLVQRLRREAARRVDLRLACRHLRQYAAQWVRSQGGAGARPWRTAPSDRRGGRLVEALTARGKRGPERTRQARPETHNRPEEGGGALYASCLRRIGDSIPRVPWLNVMCISGQRSQAAR